MSDELARMRERLAEQVVAANGICGESIASALRDVPRHLFLPDLRPDLAYADEAIVTKRDEAGRPVSSSSQPAMMAIMLYQLGLAPGQRVLEIGAGTGYNAALMQHIVGDSGQVTSVDIDPELVGKARAHLASAGYPEVTVVCADGAEGCPEHAPYDRIIATVGVSDLAPAWLDQAMPAARIVVPLDVRGTQVCVAFARADAGRWTTKSLAPCGFMRMRGSLAGPERIVTLAPGLHVTLPDGVMQPGGQDVDGEALAAVLAGPAVMRETGVSAGPAEVFWELGLWLATREPRACRVDEEGPADPARTGSAGRIGHAPLRGRGWRATVGLLDSGSIALLNASTDPAGEPSGPLTLVAAGFGPGASELAADLAADARAWDAAGRPGVAGLRVDAFPRPVAGGPAPGPGALVLERVFTRFAVYHA
ncbi:MAG TPA: methyltransferase, FxLD system [Streptosporangiaceae bacterium]|nr:methyltransferase, FxLD system [Streptosporangiaceae bacterium]